MIIGLTILFLLTPNGADPKNQVKIHSSYTVDEIEHNACPDGSYRHPVEQKCVHCDCVRDHPEYYENNCANIATQCRRVDQYLNEETGGCEECSEICSTDKFTYNKTKCEHLCRRDRCCEHTEFYNPHNGTCEQCSTVCGVEDNQTFCNINCPTYNLSTNSEKDSRSHENTTDGTLTFSHYEPLTDQPSIFTTPDKIQGNNSWLGLVIFVIGLIVLIALLAVIITFVIRCWRNVSNRDTNAANQAQNLNVVEPLLPGVSPAAGSTARGHTGSRDAATLKHMKASESRYSVDPVSRNSGISSPVAIEISSLEDMRDSSPEGMWDPSPQDKGDLSSENIMDPTFNNRRDQSGEDTLLKPSPAHVNDKFAKHIRNPSSEDTRYNSPDNIKNSSYENIQQKFHVDNKDHSPANIEDSFPEDFGVPFPKPAYGKDKFHEDIRNRSPADKMDPSSANVHVRNPSLDNVGDSYAGGASAATGKDCVIEKIVTEKEDDQNRRDEDNSITEVRQNLISGDRRDTNAVVSNSAINSMACKNNLKTENKEGSIMEVSDDLVNKEAGGMVFSGDASHSITDKHDYIELLPLNNRDENTAASHQNTPLKQFSDSAEHNERNKDNLISLHIDSIVDDWQQNDSQIRQQVNTGIQVASDGSQSQSLAERNSGSLTTQYGIQETNLDNSDPIVKDPTYSV